MRRPLGSIIGINLILALTLLLFSIEVSSNWDFWQKFKHQYGKTYRNSLEEEIRYEIFKLNIWMIDEHNKKYENGQESWSMRYNQFADLTEEEFKSKYLMPISSLNSLSTNTFKLALNASVPDNIDWRVLGAVTPVKNQLNCGCCWAISAIGAIEGQNSIKHNLLMELSIQELIDCSISDGNRGCRGGLMDYAFKYIKNNGISKDCDYPFTAEGGYCKPHSNSSGIKLIGYTDVAQSENELKEAVGIVGPVSIGINALSMRFYNSGIFDDPSCPKQVNHGVLAIGYGSENNHDYWIVKNSWGSEWGEQGYIKMTRNKNNQCGIASRSSYPTIL